jgi:RNA 2',3'-cyclic 3'-phosphodiesterase
VETGARLRLFVALLLPDEIVEPLAEWQTRELAGQPGLRIVPRANLHITVAFLGGRPADDLGGILRVLRETAARACPLVFVPGRYRETRSAAMIVLKEEQRAATALTARIFDGLERLGVYRSEERDWLPHVTVARFRQRPRLAPSLPDLGPVVSSEVAVMMSRLRPSGAEYEVLESVSLGG